MINSYGSIYSLGHKAVADIFNGPVEITEKIDGSQLSFGMINGELSIRSKNQQLYIDADNGMFNLAVEKIKELSPTFHDNWVYRGEYLMKPKHNTLAYSRVPRNNIIIYDIETPINSATYLPWKNRNWEAQSIGFEAVPTFFDGIEAFDLEEIKHYLENESILGGVKVEGIVVKNYAMFTEDKKVAKAKFVSAEFQESHQREWKKTNPGRKDVIEELIESYRVPARWQKAVQHLREDGRLEGSPRDIGNLIKAAQEDLKKEEEEVIKDILFKHFFPQISRGSVAGLPDWFKEQIALGEV